MLRAGEVEAGGASLYLPNGPAARSAPEIEGVLLGKRHPFLHVARANRMAAQESPWKS